MDKITFFVNVLYRLKIPIKNNNLDFLLTWSNYEGKGTGLRNEGGLNNPLNTTYDLKDVHKQTVYNTAGVKNYKTTAAGVEATAKTLSLGYYKNIVQGLRQNKSTGEMLNNPLVRSELQKWGSHTFATSKPIKTQTIQAGTNLGAKILLAGLLLTLIYLYIKNINYAEINSQ